jgi:2-oxoglutarate/2-oxoacid ferredoxin oxidoreductase subunit beta
MNINDFKSDDPVAWCPGCGNFGILTAVKKALVTLGRKPNEVLLVSGIGQAAKTPHYVKCNCFNGLHGRSLPAAVGAKLANRELTVIVTTGDGDCYGEGGNHLLHNIRRNVDITVIVHDNQIYGLTKGQASPTTDPAYVTRVQPDGVVLEAFHPLEFAIALDAGFVARGFSKESNHLAGLIVEGVKHKGFSLIDVLQPCVTFNKKNTYEWYAQRIYKLDAGHDPGDKAQAYVKAAEWGERIPIGVIYRNSRPSYEEIRGLDKRKPLVDEDISRIDISPLLQEYT